MDFDLEPSLVIYRYMQCRSTNHTWHLCGVICQSQLGFKRSRVSTKAWWTDGETDKRTDAQTRGIKQYFPLYYGGGINNILLPIQIRNYKFKTMCINMIVVFVSVHFVEFLSLTIYLFYLFCQYCPI